MSQTNADTFRKTLQQIELSKDPSALVGLFHTEATVDTPAHEAKLSGHTAIEKFWGEYLAAFETVRSDFTVEQTIGDTSVLQWVSEGTLPTGRPIRYRGVTILTFKGHKIATFTAYFDSAAFVVATPETPVGKPTSAPTPAPTSTTAPTLTLEVGATNNEGGD